MAQNNHKQETNMKTKLSIAVGIMLATTRLCGAMETEKSETDGKINDYSNTINDQSNQSYNYVEEEYDIDLNESGYVLGAEWRDIKSRANQTIPAPVTSKAQEDKHQVDFDLDESCFVFDRETREHHAKVRANQITPVPYTSKTLEDRHPNDGSENINDDFNLARGEGLPYTEIKNPSEKLDYKNGHQTVTQILPDGCIRLADNWIVYQPKPDPTNKAQDNNSSDK